MAIKFSEIFTLLLTGTRSDKGKVKISQNYVAFSEYMNFNKEYFINWKKGMLIQKLFFHIP